MTYKSYSCEETEKIAYALAEKLHGGEIITLDGDLGAGKTAFVRGLAAGLGISDRVVSPTFTIVNEYSGEGLPLFHFDVYRIGSPDEMYDIGWEDYLGRGGVTVIEWAVNIEEILKDEKIIKITIDKDLDVSEDYRIITVEGDEQE
mgnify:FL=1